MCRGYLAKCNLITQCKLQPSLWNINRC